MDLEACCLFARQAGTIGLALERREQDCILKLQVNKLLKVFVADSRLLCETFRQTAESVRMQKVEEVGIEACSLKTTRAFGVLIGRLLTWPTCKQGQLIACVLLRLRGEASMQQFVSRVRRVRGSPSGASSGIGVLTPGLRVTPTIVSTHSSVKSSAKEVRSQTRTAIHAQGLQLSRDEPFWEEVRVPCWCIGALLVLTTFMDLTHGFAQCSLTLNAFHQL